ncbi:MAG: hypothetical protein DRI44_05740 [Chlamydiae bacterium]|nr:MAG: hypothetical protein DRI44_05740 [Chlamydiota bacterium]
MPIVNKATVTYEVWRKQQQYKKSDGWRVVNDLGNGKLAIAKDTRTRDDNIPMTMRDRHYDYKHQVADNKDYTYLHDRAIPKSIDNSEMEKLYRTDKDRRKYYLPSEEDTKKRTILTHDSKYEG